MIKSRCRNIRESEMENARRNAVKALAGVDRGSYLDEVRCQ